MVYRKKKVSLIIPLSKRLNQRKPCYFKLYYSILVNSYVGNRKKGIAVMNKIQMNVIQIATGLNIKYIPEKAEMKKTYQKSHDFFVISTWSPSLTDNLLLQDPNSFTCKITSLRSHSMTFVSPLFILTLEYPSMFSFTFPK